MAFMSNNVSITVRVQVSKALFWVVMEHYGQYTILGRIGEGAHGIVFKAKHIEVS